jgi:hypothetical protein
MTRGRLHLGGWAAFVAVLAATAGAMAVDAVGLAGRSEGDAPYSTWIESRASHAFDAATPELRGLQVAYRVDAHVLLPLGFTSLELWQRPGVGTAVASYHDYRDGSGQIVRAFELFSISDPERAQGFDRCGFFREALLLSPSGVEWTAYFGAMTSWPEKTLSEARSSANGPQPHTYEAIDGLSSPLETRSSVFQASTDARLTDPGALWAAVRPQLERQTPRSVASMAGTPARPLPTLAFLGAVQASLRSAAAHRDRPLAPAETRIPFTHNGIVRQLELASMSVDLRRGRKAVAAGLSHDAADVFQLRYRILNPGRETGEFVLWAELPAGITDDVLTPPLPPIGWEMQLRSYLKLDFERTR